MSMEFGAQNEDAISEEQQSAPPAEEQNSALDSDESLLDTSPYDQSEEQEGQEETQEQEQEDEQDAETSPGVQDRINQMRRKLGDVERREQNTYEENQELRKRLDAIEAAEKKVEVPKEQTVDYWMDVKRLPEYVDDIKIQDQCNLNIQRIVAKEAVKEDRDEQDKKLARQGQHDATYVAMVATYPQYAMGSKDFYEAKAIFDASPAFQTLSDGIELAIYKHMAIKSAPKLQKAEDGERDAASKLKKEVQKNELGTSTRAAPKSKKRTKVQDEYSKFLKTGDAKELIKAKLNL